MYMTFKKTFLLCAGLFALTPLLPEGNSFTNNYLAPTETPEEYLSSNLEQGVPTTTPEVPTDEEDSGLSTAALGGIIGGAVGLAGGIGAAVAYKKSDRFKARVNALGSTIKTGALARGAGIASGFRATGSGIAAPFKAIARKASELKKFTAAKYDALKEKRAQAKATATSTGTPTSTSVSANPSAPSSSLEKLTSATSDAFTRTASMRNILAKKAAGIVERRTKSASDSAIPEASSTPARPVDPAVARSVSALAFANSRKPLLAAAKKSRAPLASRSASEVSASSSTDAAAPEGGASGGSATPVKPGRVTPTPAEDGAESASPEAGVPTTPKPKKVLTKRKPFDAAAKRTAEAKMEGLGTPDSPSYTDTSATQPLTRQSSQNFRDQIAADKAKRAAQASASAPAKETSTRSPAPAEPNEQTARASSSVRPPPVPAKGAATSTTVDAAAQAKPPPAVAASAESVVPALAPPEPPAAPAKPAKTSLLSKLKAVVGLAPAAVPEKPLATPVSTVTAEAFTRSAAAQPSLTSTSEAKRTAFAARSQPVVSTLDLSTSRAALEQAQSSSRSFAPAGSSRSLTSARSLQEPRRSVVYSGTASQAAVPETGSSRKTAVATQTPAPKKQVGLQRSVSARTVATPKPTPGSQRPVGGSATSTTAGSAGSTTPRFMSETVSSSAKRTLPQRATSMRHIKGS